MHTAQTSNAISKLIISGLFELLGNVCQVSLHTQSLIKKEAKRETGMFKTSNRYAFALHISKYNIVLE